MNTNKITFNISKKKLGEKYPTYFIADIASNHDGSLIRAIELIHMAAEAGADAAKFQNFYAKTLVSDYGFRSLKKIKSHQSKWKSSVYEIYKQNEVSLDWTEKLSKACKKYKIDYLTTTYDNSIISYLQKFVSAWKIGSGDITWHEHILNMAKTNKPIIIATGASNLKEVEEIFKKVKKINNKICLMQCNTNYTASSENFNYINLNVLKLFKNKFNSALLGLSDHTLGHETVLGAIALGARIIEKHFTDDNNRNGPDHKFSMNPKTWKEMVYRSRNLEKALGDGKKIVEKNELNTVILQRRAIRVNKDFKKGEKLKKIFLEFLRPCPKDAIPCYDVNKILNKKFLKKIKKNDYIKKKKFFK
jgi:N-acetylneuraminate synthase